MQKENIYQFIDLPRVDPPKKPIENRKQDFVEIYQEFTLLQAQAQADRCLSCGNPYCQFKCPLNNNIPNWLRLVYENRIIDAANLAYSTNTLPEICGRVCPQDRLCEGSCTLNAEFGAVTIGAIERFIIEEAIRQGWSPDNKYKFAPKINKKVAIIGSGPAGLGCADILIRNGIDVEVYEKQPEIGGLLTFGIPAFKLEKDVIIRRREFFESAGIRFHLGVDVGKDISMDTILNKNDAVFLGVGTYQSIKAGIPHEDASGIYSALPFLIANTKHIMGLGSEEFIDVKDKKVVVLGGGDTAMDCVRTSLRLGVKEVICAYRRDENNMPGSKKEVINAKEEGAKFYFNAQPLEIEVNKSGNVTGIKVIKTKLIKENNTDRSKLEKIPNSEEIIKCDVVLIAFGFSPHIMPWLEPLGVEIDSKGRIVLNNQYQQQTSNQKIFAGGDITRGSDLVVTAIAEGRTAAQNIMDYLDV